MSAINATAGLTPPINASVAGAAAPTTQPAAAKTDRDGDSVTISDAAKAAQGGGDKDHDGDSE